MTKMHCLACSVVLAATLAACSDSANDRGVGAECTTSDDCTEAGQTCLAFKGGYFGEMGCTQDSDCPEGAACVTHDDGLNYCFLVCDVKADCNANRTPENEANCSSTADFVEGAMDRKACSPPSST